MYVLHVCIVCNFFSSYSVTRDCPGCSNRCHLSREGGQFCCNSVCAAGCDGGGDSDQCRVSLTHYACVAAEFVGSLSFAY